jgi:hypothetical protein
MTSQADTPLCLVSHDGHVLSIAATEQARQHLRRHHAVLAALDAAGVVCSHGLSGSQLKTLPWHEATAGQLAGSTCEACTLLYACGCTSDTVAAGQCGHGTLEQVHQVMRRLRDQP